MFGFILTVCVRVEGDALPPPPCFCSCVQGKYYLRPSPPSSLYVDMGDGFLIWCIRRLGLYLLPCIFCCCAAITPLPGPNWQAGHLLSEPHCGYIRLALLCSTLDTVQSGDPFLRQPVPDALFTPSYWRNPELGSHLPCFFSTTFLCVLASLVRDHEGEEGSVLTFKKPKSHSQTIKCHDSGSVMRGYMLWKLKAQVLESERPTLNLGCYWKYILIFLHDEQGSTFEPTT